MLLDQYGKKIDSPVVNRLQSSGAGMVFSAQSSHPSRGITPARLNEILESAEAGNITAQHELFNDIEERDTHVFAEMSKRKRAVLKVDWSIEPPRRATSADKKLAEYVHELILDMADFEDLQLDLLDAIGHGFSPVELEWQRIGSDWTINRFYHRPQSWFMYDKNQSDGIKLRNETGTGVELQQLSWLVHIHRAKSGYLSRCGLFRVLAWPYLFKYFSAGDWAEFLDIYGIPMRIGKYPAQATDDEKATLWRAVAGIGHNAAGIMPQSMAIELQDAVKGSEKPFEAMIKWCERSQSKAILGSVLTSDTGATGMGSGVADIHNAVRIEIRDSDCKQLAGTLTRSLIYPLLAVNKGIQDIRRCPRFVFNVREIEDMAIYSDALPKLVDVGQQIPVSWVAKKLGIPEPINNEPVLQRKLQPNSRADLRAALTSQGDSINPDIATQNAIQDAIDMSGDNLNAAAKAWIKPALDALKSSDTPEAALDILSTANNLTDYDILMQALTTAMLVSELLGDNTVQLQLTQP